MCPRGREPARAYHATGRSAAMYVPGYGPESGAMLTRASSGFFAAPPLTVFQIPR